MRITDVINESTFQIRDTLDFTLSQISQAKSEKALAEEIWKRSKGDISNKNDVEKNAKRDLDKLQDKISDLAKQQEDLDRALKEVNEAYMLCIEEETLKQRILRETGYKKKSSITEFNKATKTKEEAEKRIENLVSEYDDYRLQYLQQLGIALDGYLFSQAENLQKAFVNEELHLKNKHFQEDFEKRRHEDPIIAQLWEQYQELSNLLLNSKVAAVRDMLQIQMNSLIEKMRELHPGAMMVETYSYGEIVIEELLYFINQEKKAVILLPISIEEWGKIKDGDESDSTARAVCFLWSFLNELNLKTIDGGFEAAGKYISYKSSFGSDEIEALQSFSVRCQNSEIFRFMLTKVPDELTKYLLNAN